MSTDISDWIGAEVERSFGQEPPLRDPRTYAVRGRRAQRRRLAVSGAAGLAVVAAITTLVLGGSPVGAGANRGIEPAGPSSGATKVTTPVPIDPATEVECRDRVVICDNGAIGWDDVHLDGSGQVVRGSADVHVTGYYDHVFGDAYGASAAVEVSRDGETVWILMTSNHDHTEGVLHSEVPDPSRTFNQWVADGMAAGRWFAYANGYES